MEEINPFAGQLPFRDDSLPADVVRYLSEQATQLRTFAGRAVAGGLAITESYLETRYASASVPLGSQALIQRNDKQAAKARFVKFSESNVSGELLMAAPLAIGVESVRAYSAVDSAVNFLGLNFTEYSDSAMYGWLPFEGLFELESSDFDVTLTDGMCMPSQSGKLVPAVEQAVGYRLKNSNYVYLFGYVLTLNAELADYTETFSTIDERLELLENSPAQSLTAIEVQLASLQQRAEIAELAVTRLESIVNGAQALEVIQLQSSEALSQATQAMNLLAELSNGLDIQTARITNVSNVVATQEGALAEQKSLIEAGQGSVRVVGGVAAQAGLKTRAYLELEVAVDESSAVARLTADEFGGQIDLIADRIRLGSAEDLAMEVVGGDVIFYGNVTVGGIPLLDFSNMIPDGALQDIAAWDLSGTGGGEAGWSIATPTAFSSSSGRAVEFNGSYTADAGTTHIGSMLSSHFAVMPGQRYQIVGSAWVESGATGTAHIQIIWLDKTGTEISGDTILTVNIASTGLTQTGDTILQAPVNAAFAAIRFRRGSVSNGGACSGIVWFFNNLVRKAVGTGALIDSSVETIKLALDSVRQNYYTELVSDVSLPAHGPFDPPNTQVFTLYPYVKDSNTILELTAFYLLAKNSTQPDCKWTVRCSYYKTSGPPSYTLVGSIMTAFYDFDVYTQQAFTEPVATRKRITGLDANSYYAVSMIVSSDQDADSYVKRNSNFSIEAMYR